MATPLLPDAPMSLPYQLFPALFTPADCAEVRAYAQGRPGQTGTVGYGGKQTVHDMRRAEVRWLDVADEHLTTLVARFHKALHRANANHWGLDWRAIMDLQFSTYAAWNAGHYDWHRDDNPGAVHTRPFDRLLSVVLLLSPPAEFDGGSFQVKAELDSQNVPLNQGDCVVFPSALLHRVTPVTQGVRHSLVSWAEGPRLPVPITTPEPVTKKRS